MKKHLLCALLGLLPLAAPANAGVIVSITEIENAIRFDYSGTLDLTGMTGTAVGGSSWMANPSNGFLYLNNTGDTPSGNTMYSVSLQSGSQVFGTASTTNINSATGDKFLLGTSSIVLASDFTVGTVGGSAVINNATWTSLGLFDNIAFTYAFANGETISITGTNPAIPEPSTYAAFAGIAALAGAWFHRRRKQQA